MRSRKRFTVLAGVCVFLAIICTHHGFKAQAEWVDEESECSYTLLPWLDGECLCYGANGVVYDSCEGANIDPDDPESAAISACYWIDPSYECTTVNVPCGLVVRLNRPCNQSGSHMVVATFPNKPPCGGAGGACSDNHGGSWP